MRETGVEIRQLRREDVATLQRIRKAAFAPIFRSFAELVGPEIAPIAFARADSEQAALLDDLCQPGGNSEMLVVMIDDAIVGFVSFTFDAAKPLGEIGLNAVDPEHAGKGVGTMMYEHVLAVMKERGVEVVEVGTGGDASHAPARRAYAKAGFSAAIPSVALYRRL